MDEEEDRFGGPDDDDFDGVECDEDLHGEDVEDEDDSPHARLADGTYFADPGGKSALRAATRSNPRNLPCPECGTPNALTPADRACGYRCDRCADRAESGGY